MTPRRIIGLASGSSADEVDAALLEVEGVGLDMRPRLIGSLHQPYNADLKELIRRVSGPGPCEARQVALLHRLLGETFAAAARAAADQASLGLHQVQVVGCPGHTVWHDSDGRFPSTLPLGMAAVVAERCGVTTVSDFRSRDVAAGGLGVAAGRAHRLPPVSQPAREPGRRPPRRPRPVSCSCRPADDRATPSASRPGRATRCWTP